MSSPQHTSSEINSDTPSSPTCDQLMDLEPQPSQVEHLSQELSDIHVPFEMHKTPPLNKTSSGKKHDLTPQSLVPRKKSKDAAVQLMESVEEPEQSGNGNENEADHFDDKNTDSADTTTPIAKEDDAHLNNRPFATSNKAESNIQEADTLVPDASLQEQVPETTGQQPADVSGARSSTINQKGNGPSTVTTAEPFKGFELDNIKNKLSSKKRVEVFSSGILMPLAFIARAGGRGFPGFDMIPELPATQQEALLHANLANLEETHGHQIGGVLPAMLTLAADLTKASVSDPARHARCEQFERKAWELFLRKNVIVIDATKSYVAAAKQFTLNIPAQYQSLVARLRINTNAEDSQDPVKLRNILDGVIDSIGRDNSAREITVKCASGTTKNRPLWTNDPQAAIEEHKKKMTAKGAKEEGTAGAARQEGRDAPEASGSAKANAPAAKK